MGIDLEQFQSAAHLASWAKLCPGNHESAGKRKSASVGKGNNWLRSTLVQAAHAALRVKDSYLQAAKPTPRARLMALTAAWLHGAAVG